MRFASSFVTAVIWAIAVPSVGGAQELAPFSGVRLEHRGLAHAVPVATVNLVGDAVALANPRTVENSLAGEPFVLGAASLDLRDPSDARIWFTIQNASAEPVPWNTVLFRVWRASPVPIEDQQLGAPEVSFCSLGQLGLGDAPTTLWPPGATATVQVPLPRDCWRRGEPADPLALLVYVGKDLPHPDLLLGPSDPGWDAVGARWNALLREAIERLAPESRH